MILRNAWYIAARKGEVGRGLLARTLCKEPVVLFRRQDGTPAALEDRCCHRHLPLSKGRLIGDVVQCGYHGLEFDAAGTCLRVPGQTRAPPGAKVKSYPVVERHGLVWIWIGDAANADPSDIPDYHWLADPGWKAVGGSIPLVAHYMYSIDNLLDLTLETYVHASTLGAAGIIETLACVLAMQERLLPGTPRLSRAAEDTPPSLVKTPQAVTRLNYILKLNTGFGGMNGALILSHA